MKIAVIGHIGHEKSTLIQAILSTQAKSIKLVEMKTKDLL